MNSKKLVSIITSAATIAMTASAAFLPMATGAQTANPWTLQTTNPISAQSFNIAADEANDVVFMSNGTNLNSYYLDGSLREVVDVAPMFFTLDSSGNLYALFTGNIVKKYPNGHPAGATSITLGGITSIGEIRVDSSGSGMIIGRHVLGSDSGSLHAFDSTTGTPLWQTNYDVNSQCATLNGDFLTWNIIPGYSVELLISGCESGSAMSLLGFQISNGQGLGGARGLIGSDINLANPSVKIAFRSDLTTYAEAYVVSADSAGVADYMQVFDLFGYEPTLAYNVPFPSGTASAAVFPGVHKLYTGGANTANFSSSVVSCYWDGVGTPCPSFTPTPPPPQPNPACGVPVTTWSAGGQPTGVEVSGASVYVVTGGASGSGALKTYNFSGSPQATLVSGLVDGQGVTMDANGDIYIVSESNNRVYKYDYTGSPITSFAAAGRPFGIEYNHATGLLYVAEASGNRVEKFNLSGVSQGFVGAGVVTFPIDVDLDGDGNLYVLNSNPAKVFKFDRFGSLLQQWDVSPTSGGGIEVTVATPPLVFVSTSDTAKDVHVFTASGNFIQTFNIDVTSPRMMDTDSSGNLYIADNNGQQVEKVNVAACGTTPTTTPTPTPPTGDYKDILTFSLQTVGDGPATFGAIEGVQLRVYDTDDSAFRAAYGTTPAQWRTKLDLIYKAEVGLVTWCETDNDGACTAFKSAAGNYLAVGRYDDSATSKSVYVSRQELASDFNADLENFADLKVIKKFNNDNSVTYGPFGQVVVTPIAVASSGAGGTLVVAILILAAGLGLGAYLIPKMRK